MLSASNGIAAEEMLMTNRPDDAWYTSTRWRLHRRQPQLRRQPLCEWCRDRGRITEATIAHHAEPHGGDPVKFWSGALVSLCKHCHDSRAQQIERKGWTNDIDDSGWPADPNHPANKITKQRDRAASKWWSEFETQAGPCFKTHISKKNIGR
jgi:5-methylcytosine-specific restriction enzyme A